METQSRMQSTMWSQFLSFLEVLPPICGLAFHGKQNSTGLGCWNRALRLLNMFPSISSEYTHPWSLWLDSIIMRQNMILVFFFIQIPTLISFIGFFFSLVSLHLYPRCTTGIKSLPSHQKSQQALFSPYLNINRGWFFTESKKTKANTESLLSAGKTKKSQDTSKHTLLLDTWFPLFSRQFPASWLCSVPLPHTAVDTGFGRRSTWEREWSHARAASTAWACTERGLCFKLWATCLNKVQMRYGLTWAGTSLRMCGCCYLHSQLTYRRARKRTHCK